MSKRYVYSGASVCGFTLVELLVSIALMSLMAGYFIYNRMESLKQQMAQNIAQEILTIGNKAEDYYANSGSNQWPDNDTSVTNCQNPVAELAAAGYLPVGYTTSVAMNFDCLSPVLGLGTAFQIQVVFVNADKDIADILMGVLPVAKKDTSDPAKVKINYILTPPRKLEMAGQNVHFYKQVLAHNSTVNIPIPNCVTGSPKYVAVPQSVCYSGVTSYGLGGYLFSDVQAGSNWTITLKVAAGNETSDTIGSDGTVIRHKHWVKMGDDCNGKPVDIGVVTFCG